ncbi:small-conductance mechanosensitive channel [Candidatus Magnetoovum chiemensis]|nr:small-conductance mechanosensitive channel [Candidatus Magnetoovum chiemensis]
MQTSDKIIITSQSYCRLRINLTALILLITMFYPSLCLCQTTTEQNQQTSTPETVSPALSPTLNPIESVQNKLSEIRERSKAAKETQEGQTAQTGSSIGIDDLQGIEALYERQLKSLNELEELKRKEKELKDDKNTLIDAHQPYTLSLLDEYSEKLNSALNKKQAFTDELTLSEKILTDAAERFKKADKDLNVLKTDIDKNKKAEDSLKLKLLFSDIETEREIAKASFECQEIQHHIYQKNISLVSLQIELYEQQIEQIRNNLSYSETDLENQLDKIGKTKDELSKETASLNKKFEASERSLVETKETFLKAKDEEAANKARTELKAKELWNKAYKQALENSTKTIQLLIQQEDLWRKRYDLIKYGMSDKELKEWEKKANEQYKGIEDNINTIQRNQVKLQYQSAETENKINNIDSQAILKKYYEQQYDAMNYAVNSNYIYLSYLEKTKTLYDIFFKEMDFRQLQTNLWRKTYASIENFIYIKVFNNTLLDYALAITYFIAGMFLILITKVIVFKRLIRLAHKREIVFLNETIIWNIRRMVIPLLYFGVTFVSLQGLELNWTINKVVKLIGIAALTFLFVRFLVSLLDYVVKEQWLKKERYIKHESSLRAILPVIKLITWLIGIMFLFDNFGFKISAIMAGLGIGGIAIALASQNILGDLFNYFVILFDRPFVIGDFIIIGEYMGNIEQIGIKTTKVRSLSGEQLIFSNTRITNEIIKNYRRMNKRRVLFHIGVTYQTTMEHIKEIPALIKNIITSYEEYML